MYACRRRVLAKYLLGKGWRAVHVPAAPLRRGYTTAAVMRERVVARAYHVARRLSVKQAEYRAMAATQDVMHGLQVLFRLTCAMDLVLWTAMVVSYLLGLRLSDACLLRTQSLEVGAAQVRADIGVGLVASKADGGGEGYTRYLQHVRGCPYEMRTAPGNADGRGYCPNWACGRTAHGAWCGACLVLHYLVCLGVTEGSEDGWLFRLPTGTLSFARGRSVDAQPSAFSADAMPYTKFNALLHKVRIRANEARAAAGLPEYSEEEFHWHMFRHGNVMMALIFGDSPGEIMRRLRMDASTLESYRHHTSAMYRLVLSEQSVDADTQEQATRLEVTQLAAAMLTLLRSEHSWTAATIAHELLSFLRHIGCSMRALHNATPLFWQLAVTSAVTSGFLDETLSAALLEALGGTCGGTFDAAGGSVGGGLSMLLSTLIEPGSESIVDGHARTGALDRLDAEVDCDEGVGDAVTQYGGSSSTVNSEATQSGPSAELLSVAALKDVWVEVAADLRHATACELCDDA